MNPLREAQGGLSKVGSYMASHTISESESLGLWPIISCLQTARCVSPAMCLDTRSVGDLARTCSRVSFKPMLDVGRRSQLQVTLFQLDKTCKTLRHDMFFPHASLSLPHSFRKMALENLHFSNVKASSLPPNIKLTSSLSAWRCGIEMSQLFC